MWIRDEKKKIKPSELLLHSDRVFLKMHSTNIGITATATMLHQNSHHAVVSRSSSGTAFYRQFEENRLNNNAMEWNDLRVVILHPKVNC